MGLEWRRKGEDILFSGNRGAMLIGGAAAKNTAGYQSSLVRSGRTGLLKMYADDGGAVLWGTGSVPDLKATQSRLLLTIDQTGGNIRAFGLMGQVKSYDGYWNGEQVGAVYGRLEIAKVSNTVVLGGYGISAAGAFTVDTTGAMTVNTNHFLAGVAAISDFKATLTQTGICPAFLAAQYNVAQWSDSTARGTTWTHGFYIATQGVAISAFGFGSASTYLAGAKIAAMTTTIGAQNGSTASWQGAIKIDVAGTAYYIPIASAANMSGY